MKQLLKVLIIFSLLISTLIIYINPEINAEANDQWEKIKERGELRVGLSADYAPYEFEHNVNGKTKYAGIDIDIGFAAAVPIGLARATDNTADNSTVDRPCVIFLSLSNNR